ncbi:MAG TPA: TraB/GumN family protein [Vicinamibacterales bacterium]|nr:TraB/GumN family protein [Vicinamibacterales bacterium]
MMTLLRSRARFVAVAIVVAASASLAAQATAPSGKSFLWKIQAGSNVVYLAGSVHALNADAYPLSAAFERAFNESGTLVEEIDLAEAGSPTLAPVLLAKGMYLDGRRFDGSVSKETAALVAGHLKQSGLPAEMIQAMKPWMVMLTVAALEVQKAGLDPNLGLDRHFFTRAKNTGKAIVGLETAESQIDRLDRMPDALQEQLLRSAIEDLELQRNEWKTLMSAWRGGDAATMEKMLLSSFKPYPAAYQSLIVERNRNWMPLIDACFGKPRPCLVVVGAAHLVGPDGLLTMMRGKGYRVEQQ